MKRDATIFATLVTAFALSMCSPGHTPDLPVAEGNASTEKPGPDEAPRHADACMTPIPAGDSAKYISKQVEVLGDVEFPLTLTVDSLKGMNVVTPEDFNVVCQSGATLKEDKTCKGVLLKDILEKANIAQSNHKDRNFYIVARASDNYKATFSWAEIFNNPTGENVYVLFEENGEPIKSQGDMILNCKNDIKTGPRHVTWLKSIRVNRVS